MTGDGFEPGDTWTDGLRVFVVVRALADGLTVEYVDCYPSGERVRRLGGRLAWELAAREGRYWRMEG